MNYLWVGLGGAIGSMLRFFTVDVIGRTWPAVSFPFGTLTVNIIGCFVISFIGALATERITLTGDVRLFLFTGILGGFV
jgi:CrcB protein